MPFQKVDPNRPLVLTLPSIELDEGMHIVSYYVQSASGEQVDVIPSIGVAAEDQEEGPDVQHLGSASEAMQTCACEQLFQDRQPDAANWFNLYKNAVGDHDLFVSEDHGQSWIQPEITGRIEGGCPKFGFAAPQAVLAKADAAEAHGSTPDLDWAAFPSPFTDKLSLRVQVPEEERIVVRLIDTQGRVIQEVQKQGSGSLLHDFDTSRLAQGPYYITVLTETVSYSRVVVRI